MMKTIVLELCRDEFGMTYIIPERYQRIDKPYLYNTYTEHVGVFTKVIVISDLYFDYDYCRKMAICYITKRYRRFEFSLAKDSLYLWEEVK